MLKIEASEFAHLTPHGLTLLGVVLTKIDFCGHPKQGLTLGSSWSGKKKKKKPLSNDRYYSKKNRSVIKAAPAATAHSLKSKQHVQKLIDEQAPKLTLYETSFHDEHDSGTFGLTKIL